MQDEAARLEQEELQLQREIEACLGKPWMYIGLMGDRPIKPHLKVFLAM